MGKKGALKKERRSRSPASLCDVEPHARSGRSVGAARPFGLWITRSAPWLPTKRRRDPGLGPLFNVAWLRRGPNLGQAGSRTAVELAAQ